MRYPEFLKENGTIGFVAPAFGCNIEPYKSAFANAQRKFMEMGYQIETGPNCYAAEGIGISNTPAKCGAEINEYYQSETNDILISCGGGELMCEVLDYIDWKAIKNADPKWFMGYSDNTNMTFLLATLCDVASVYGPGAPAFGMEPWHQALYDAMGVLTGAKRTLHGYGLWEKEGLKDEEHPLMPYNVTEPSVLHTFVPGKNHTLCETEDKTTLKGRLLGGCMDCLVNLLGTKYDYVKDFNERYEEDGIIWFLESCDLNVMSIRRAMWQMEHAGWFAKVKGFIIGRPLCFGQQMMGLDQYKAVCDIVAHHNVPVIMDVDLGHIAPMMPVVCGSKAEVTVCGNDFNLVMQYV